MCKEISTGEILAMKVLKKEMITSDIDYDAVLAENNVLRKIKHPFVTVGHAASFNNMHLKNLVVLHMHSIDTGNTLMPGLVVFIIIIILLYLSPGMSDELLGWFIIFTDRYID